MASPLFISAALASAVGLVCFCLATECSQYTRAQWNSGYDLVLGASKGQLLSQPVVESTIAQLHTGAAEPVDKDKKALVDFFYDANEHKSEHCSSEWIKRLNKPYETYVKLGNSPMSLYCSRLRVKTKRMCSEKFVDWARTAIALSEDKMTQLVNIIENIQDPLRKRFIGQQMVDLFGSSGTTSYADFKKAWTNGPCGTVLKGLAAASREMAKIIKFVEEIGPNDRPQAASNMLNVVATCKKLESDKELKAVYKHVGI